jgi:hypothetical protein
MKTPTHIQKDRVYINDPELGRIELINSDDTPEEIIRKEKEIKKRIEHLPTEQ